MLDAFGGVAGALGDRLWLGMLGSGFLDRGVEVVSFLCWWLFGRVVCGFRFQVSCFSFLVCRFWLVV
jgi:hypothetical protein